MSAGPNESEMMTMVGQFLELQRQKRGLEADLRAVKDGLAALQDPLIDEFIQQGIQSMTAQRFTVYIHTQKWAHAENKLDAVHVLMDNGHEECVTYNTSQVSVLFRGTPEEVEGLPPDIRKAFDVTQVVSLRARKASSRVK